MKNNRANKKIKSDSISFVPMSESHIPLWEKWSKLPHVADVWFIDGYEAPSYIHQKIEGNGFDYPFIFEYHGVPIGYIVTSDLFAYRKICVKKASNVFNSETEGTFCVDLFIGEKEYLDRGIGTMVVSKFIKKVKNDFYAKKIVIDPASDNLRAIRCYEKVGFKKIKSEFDGVFEVTIMEYL